MRRNKWKSFLLTFVLIFVCVFGVEDAGRAAAQRLNVGDAGRTAAEQLDTENTGRAAAEQMDVSDAGRAAAQRLDAGNTGRAAAEQMDAENTGRAAAERLDAWNAGRAATQRPGVNGKGAQETENNARIVVYVAIAGEDDQGHKVSVGKTPVQIEAGATADQAVEQALQKAGYGPDRYVMEDTGYGVNLCSVGDIANASDWSYYWALYINGSYAQDSLGNTVIQDNDKISYVYVSLSDTETNGSAEFEDDASLDPDQNRQAELLNTAKKQQDILAASIFQDILASDDTIYGIENPDALYIAFSLMRAGYPAQELYDQMYAKVQEQLREIKTKGSTDAGGDQISEETILAEGHAELTYAKIALFVTAAGGDATDVGGFDLIDTMAKKSVYEGSSAYYTTACTTLLALDSADYVIPTGEGYITRGELLDSLVGQMDSVIATALEWDSPDMVAMLLQPMGTYMSENAIIPGEKENVYDQERLQREYTKGIHFLESMQDRDGTWSGNNVWTLAQIMTAMGQMRINAVSEKDGSDFIKNGVTVLDNVSAFVDTETGTVDEDLMLYQPEQLLRGLNAVIRVIEGESPLYLVSDSDRPSSPSETAQAGRTPDVARTASPGETAQAGGTESTPDVAGTAFPGETAQAGGAESTPDAARTALPIQTAQAGGAESTPDAIRTASPSAVLQTSSPMPSASAGVPDQATPSVAPQNTEKPEEGTPVKVKKVTAVQRKLVLKKGKKKILEWKVTWSDDKKRKPDRARVVLSKRYLKVVKKNLKQGKVRVTVRGIKRGTCMVKVRVGGRTGKMKVTVK